MPGMSNTGPVQSASSYFIYFGRLAGVPLPEWRYGYARTGVHPTASTRPCCQDGVLSSTTGKEMTGEWFDGLRTSMSGQNYGG
jgi:hypothetical protein